ncbi:hypothetical protein FC36_GL001017 [Ligilactobacillus equi DSM 15833 = JCM 10991]|uniref:Protease HtpX homolog n=1 Tax=Ligilactobacillus equi DSM 15833 = JCM 10991 TaxID=1423740 RepID=A0A0R1TUM3_9LACO|nr:M48 family metallopeptidase [Ligilactobacillus equi]KRL82328.1 hypothetical protein FC36_GL001017 [Ligilactobacillus equi DSM 15833 = JCM 10991]MCQ2557454.1 M48 family metallopeptidase [Ligilactobacillus sp.]
MLYQQISANKRNTIIVLFLFAVLMVLLASFLGYIFGVKFALWFFTGSVIYATISYFYAANVLMQINDANELHPADYPQLFSMVEELCIAAALPMPRVYLIQTACPNAFATGRNPQHASIAVTTGLLQMMENDELQAVIGHELAHIKNYDTQVTTIISVLAGLISSLGLGALYFAFSFFRTRFNNFYFQIIFYLIGAVILFIGLVITCIGIPISKILYFMLSRQREYLADASSVNFTRNPDGMIRALQKLRGDKHVMPRGGALGHELYFNVGQVGSWFSNLFSTHPTLDSRISRLLDSFSVKH